MFKFTLKNHLTRMDDFLDRDPKVQKILIQMRNWSRKECIEFLKENILPNYFHALEIPEIMETLENHTEKEIKESLIKILQNVDPRNIYKPSSFN